MAQYPLVMGRMGSRFLACTMEEKKGSRVLKNSTKLMAVSIVLWIRLHFAEASKRVIAFFKGKM